MDSCYQCRRDFPSEHAYYQHMRDSPAHREPEDFEEWECDFCDRCFASENSRHQHYAMSNHPYCIECKRVLRSENNLMRHMHSRTHVGTEIPCPFCKRPFATPSGLVIHLESSNCSNRRHINEYVRCVDHRNLITRPMITMPGYDLDEDMVTTDRAWNGRAYECYLCPKEFGKLQSLNMHMKSPAHEQNIYHCPGRSCGKSYKLLSALVQHVESESCGVMRFTDVQKFAKHGIEIMIARIIGL